MQGRRGGDGVEGGGGDGGRAIGELDGGVVDGRGGRERDGGRES